MSYTFGYSDSIVKGMLSLRTAESHAKFLDPYLKPGINMLDCGCGPGSITLGLAEKIQPGQLTAIDIEKSQLAIASNTTKQNNIDNVHFQQADIYNLPFSDNSFDLIFSHAVLDHLINPELALQELKRVVKINGIIAIKAFDVSANFFYPQNPISLEAFNLYCSSVTSGGGDLSCGRKLRSLFSKAGLKNITVTAACETSGTPEQIKRIANYLQQWLSDNEYTQKLLQDGKITREKIKQYQQAWQDFGNDPNAFCCGIWCEAIGFK